MQQGGQTKFIEVGTASNTVPSWVRYCLDAGFGWPVDSTRRRITVVSMPCDTPAAGLLALGLVSRDLGVPQAQSRQRHFDYLLTFAKQYLSDCKGCDFEICAPADRGCGHVSRARGILRNPAMPNVRFVVSDKSDPDRGSLVWEYRIKKFAPVTQWAARDRIIEWHVEGEPPAFSSPHVVGLNVRPYKALFPEARFCSENLNLTSSGVCLAIPSEGEDYFDKRFRRTGFRIEADFFSVGSLLTLTNWRSRGSVSKSVLFNCRSGRIDRPIGSVCTVVADGATSIVRVLAEPEFKFCNIIGVVDRTASPDSIELLGGRLEGLRQWYTPDEGFSATNKPIPAGVRLLSVLKR